MGLCLTTMLSVEEFAALLIVGGFVNLRNNKQSGGYNVMTSDTDTWTPFLKDHKLLRTLAMASLAKAHRRRAIRAKKIQARTIGRIHPQRHGRSNKQQFCYRGQ
jgi:hypothetical protein